MARKSILFMYITDFLTDAETRQRAHDLELVLGTNIPKEINASLLNLIGKGDHIENITESDAVSRVRQIVNLLEPYFDLEVIVRNVRKKRYFDEMPFDSIYID